MSESNGKDKGVAKDPKAKKPLEYRRFEDVRESHKGSADEERVILARVQPNVPAEPIRTTSPFYSRFSYYDTGTQFSGETLLGLLVPTHDPSLRA